MLAARFTHQSMASSKTTPPFPRAAATASLIVLTLLIVVPCLVLFFAINPDSRTEPSRFFELPVTYWAVWAIFSLWAGLDSSRLLRALGKRVDPMGSQALWGLLLGALNIGASLLVVMLRTPR